MDKGKEIIMLGLLGIGLIGLIVLIIIGLLLPLILTIIVGIGFANLFGFTGITWWAFVILFYLVLSLIFTKLGL